MRFGVGVIGATGFIGAPYRKEIRESPDEAAIVALCARRREPLEAAEREDGAQLLTGDWREVVEHPEVNLVLVCTPDALHHEAVLACAKHGKHVFCEKPVAMNAREAGEMLAALREAGLAHFVPYWTRLVPAFARAKELYASGLIGEIRAVIYRWHNPRPAAMPFTWRDDARLSAAGSIADVGSHAYDTIRWILREEATRVLTHSAVLAPAKPDLGEINLGEALQWGQSHAREEAAARRRGTVCDYAAMAFELAGGAVGSIVLSHAPYLRKGFAPELELHGKQASLSVERISGEIRLARPGGEVELIEQHPFSGFPNRFTTCVFPALRAQIEGGASSVSAGDFPTLEDGYRVQCFTDAAAQSAQSGGWAEVTE